MANKYDKIRNQYNTKGVNRGILIGTKRALNKAAKSTRTFVRRELRRDVGVSSKRINDRVLMNRTEKGLRGRHSLKASVSIATKKFMPMRYFKPKTKVVKTTLQGKKKGKVTRYGVTVKIGRGRREIVPGAFLMDMRNGLVVAKRKGPKQFPTTELFTKVLQESVKDNNKTFNKTLNQRFQKIVEHEIEFAVGNILKKSK